MSRHPRHPRKPSPSGLLLLLAAVLAVGPAGCKKNKKAKPNPWARPLPRSAATSPMPARAEATVKITRKLLSLNGRRLHPLADGRLARTALRDGVDGLFVPALSQSLGRLRGNTAAGKPLGRLAIHCQPAVPFRTLRAVLYTAMRAGYLRPWLVAEGPDKSRVALPLELPSATHATGHGLRDNPPRIPALAVGVSSAGIHVTRWSRPACPEGVKPTAEGACFSGEKGGPSTSTRKRLSKHLLALARQRASRARPGSKRRGAVMVWAGLDSPVGSFVRLLDATREPPGGGGTCALAHRPDTGQWKVTSKPLDLQAAQPSGCLFQAPVLVWSRPGHRKKKSPRAVSGSGG